MITVITNILTYILFADDTNILYSHKNIDTLVDTVNHDLYNISIWFKCNKLSLNIVKLILSVLELLTPKTNHNVICL